MQYVNFVAAVNRYVNLFFICVVPMVVIYCDEMSSVVLCRGRGTRNVSDGISLLKLI